MRCQKFVLPFLVLIFIPVSLHIQKCLANEVSIYLTSQKIHKQTLNNDLIVIAKESPEQDLVAIELIIKTGSFYELDWQGSGIAHLIEHLLFKGTNKRPVGQIETQIKNLGGDINGYATYQFTGISLVIPNQYIDEGLEILKDMVTNPTFDEKELNKEREVILNEIRLNRDDPDRYLERIFMSQAYPIAPYNLPIIGRKELLLHLKRRDIVEFYNKWYVPNNMILTICGNIDSDIVMERAKRIFADFAMKPYPSKILPEIPKSIQANHHTEQYDVDVTRARLAFPGVTLFDTDAPTLDIIAAILGRGNSSRFYQRLLKDEQLVYSINSYNYTPDFRGIFAINFTLEKENTDRVVNYIFTEIEKLKTKLVSEKELNRSKNLYLSDFIFSQQTFSAQAKTLAIDAAYSNDVNFTQKYLRAITQVSQKDIKRCVQKYLSRQNYVFVKLEPKSKIPQPIKKTNPPTKFKRYLLENGLTIILKKDNSQPMVDVQCIFQGGTSWENEKTNGTFNVLSHMLLNGTTKLTSKKIAEKLEQAGTSISAFSGYNSFGISIQTLSKDTMQNLDMLYELVTNSNFPADEINKEKKLAQKAIMVQDDDIFQDTYILMKKNLFHKQTYRFEPVGNKDAVNVISRKQLIELYQTFCRPNNMVLTIIGDIDEDKIIKFLKKKFTGWAPRALPKKIIENEEEKYESLEINNQRDKEQAIIMIGFPGVNLKNSDRYGLELLNGLISAPGGLLYNLIRENYGQAYTLGGSSIAGLDSGYFFVYVATEPEITDEVKKIIFDEIYKIKNKPLDEELLPSTKNYLIGQQLINLQSNSRLSLTVALDELYGLGYANYKKYESEINNIDQQHLMDLANRYLDINKSVIVITKNKF